VYNVFCDVSGNHVYGRCKRGLCEPIKPSRVPVARFPGTRAI